MAARAPLTASFDARWYAVAHALRGRVGAPVLRAAVVNAVVIGARFVPEAGLDDEAAALLHAVVADLHPRLGGAAERARGRVGRGRREGIDRLRTDASATASSVPGVWALVRRAGCRERQDARAGRDREDHPEIALSPGRPFTM